MMMSHRKDCSINFGGLGCSERCEAAAREQLGLALAADLSPSEQEMVGHYWARVAKGEQSETVESRLRRELQALVETRMLALEDKIKATTPPPKPAPAKAAPAAHIPAAVTERLSAMRAKALAAMALQRDKAPPLSSEQEDSATTQWLEWIAEQSTNQIATLLDTGVISKDEVRTAVVTNGDQLSQRDLTDMMRRGWVNANEVRDILRANVAAGDCE